MRPTMRLLARQCCTAEVPTRIAIDAGACTRVGSRRVNNEDGHYLDPKGQVFVVADGIGGAAAGERASRTAVKLLPRCVSTLVSATDASEQEVVERIRASFGETSDVILSAARRNIQFQKMGTTAVLALLIGPRLFIASIGDSRAYLARANRIEQLTVDHTMAEALVEAGAICREQAVKHPWRHVLWKFLGSDEVGNVPDVRVVDLQADDHIVLATDGLTDVVDDPTMLQILQENHNAQDSAAALIQAAEQKNARDDATCVVLLAKELDEPAPPDWWPHSSFATESHRLANPTGQTNRPTAQFEIVRQC